MAQSTSGRAAVPGGRREELTRVVKFLCVGCAGYGFALALFALLHGPLGIDYRVSAALGNAISFAANFFVNRRWTFQAHGRPVGPQAIRFAVVSALATLTNVIAVHVLVESGGLAAFGGEALAVVIATPVSYLGNRRWTFAGARGAGTDPGALTARGRATATAGLYDADSRSVQETVAP